MIYSFTFEPEQLIAKLYNDADVCGIYVLRSYDEQELAEKRAALGLDPLCGPLRVYRILEVQFAGSGEDFQLIDHIKDIRNLSRDEARVRFEELVAAERKMMREQLDEHTDEEFEEVFETVAFPE